MLQARDDTLLLPRADAMPPRDLRLAWFDRWHPDIDAALQQLPEHEDCPHELYRMLVENPGPTRKRIALVTERGMPRAVAGLRQVTQFQWEPVTQWIIPGIVFPARTEDLIPVLDALGVHVRVAWWRMGGPPVATSSLRHVDCTPVHRMRCSEDFERYWRETGQYKAVRNSRNRCRTFSLTVNSPGSAAWVIANWDRKWSDNPARGSLSLSDRIVAAEYLEKLKRHFSFMLLDGDTPVGGCTVTAHRNDLVAGVIHREPSYGSHGVGVRLIDLTFSFAADAGYQTMDIGGGHDYKKKWAPQSGRHWQLHICPQRVYLAERLVGRVSRVLQAVVSRARRQPAH
jgi:hypothetical protein